MMGSRKEFDKKKLLVCYSISYDIVEWLDGCRNKSGLVEDLLRSEMEKKNVYCKCGERYEETVWEALGKICPICEKRKQGKETGLVATPEIISLEQQERDERIRARAEAWKRSKGVENE